MRNCWIPERTSTSGARKGDRDRTRKRPRKHSLSRRGSRFQLDASIPLVTLRPAPGFTQRNITYLGGTDQYAASVWNGNSSIPYLLDSVFGAASVHERGDISFKTSEVRVSGVGSPRSLARLKKSTWE